MDDQALLGVLHEAAGAVAEALTGVSDWGPSGTRPGQYRSDLVADRAALEVLTGAGLQVRSEESGLTGDDGPLLVVLDPLDGSTNAARGIPWYATSLCALDDAGMRAAVVMNLVSGTTFDAVRRGGARRDGVPITPSGCDRLSGAIIGTSGLPARFPGWSQFRALGSAALDLCAVAEGVLDGYTVAGGSWLHPWDYLGALLVNLEAGSVAAELDRAELVVRDAARRKPIVAATPALLDAMLRASW